MWRVDHGWIAELFVVSDRTEIGRPSPFANEPIALYDIVGNKVFVDCGSERDGKTKERCLFARDRDTC
jgi:hypothetical protein